MLSYVQCYLLLSKLGLKRKPLLKYLCNNLVYSVDSIYEEINKYYMFELFSRQQILDYLDIVDSYINNCNCIDICLIKNPFEIGVLYLKGNTSLLNDEYRKICIIGSRDISGVDAMIVEQEIIKLICNNFCIISGLALGGDTMVHQTVLDNSGKTIAVLPSGIDNIYPKSNSNLARRILNNNGLVVSPFGIKSNIYKSNFIIRDRLMVLVSKKLLVISRQMSRGVNHSIKFAKRYNIPIDYLE